MNRHVPSLLTLSLLFSLHLAACGESAEEVPEEPLIEAAETNAGDVVQSENGREEQVVEAANGVDLEKEIATGQLFQDKVNRVVGGTIPIVLIQSIDVNGQTMHVKLVRNDAVPGYEEYYETADESNRIVAITSIRWFRDLPALQTLLIDLPSPNGPLAVKLDRTEVAEYYDLSIRALAKDPSEENWRKTFVAKWDNERERAKFVGSHRR